MEDFLHLTNISCRRQTDQLCRHEDERVVKISNEKLDYPSPILITFRKLGTLQYVLTTFANTLLKHGVGTLLNPAAEKYLLLATLQLLLSESLLTKLNR